MWLYRQGTGDLYQNNTRVATGYAGAPGAVNDPAKQSVKNVGPLPCGVYTIESPQDFPMTTGMYTLSLTPDPHNEMFGRSAFKIHGDSLVHPGTASEGCVIQSRSVRERIWKSGDRLFVVV